VEYPHHLYITYLISKRLTSYEIRAECMSKGLMPPTDEAVQELSQRVEPLPRYWRMKVEKSNVPFRRWLRDRGVLAMWQRDEATEMAIKLLARGSVRKDFEAIMLLHGSEEQAHKELTLKYPEALVPPVRALKRYREFFWDVGSMSSEGIYEYIEASQDMEDYLPAVKGDIVQAYATLGLQQQMTYERLLNKVMNGGFAVMDRITREHRTIGGQNAAGLMTVVAGAMKAGQELEQLHTADNGDDSIKRDAAEFMHRRITQVKDIPSIDEVGRDYIDAEFVEAGADNVHRLPVRND